MSYNVASTKLTAYDAHNLINHKIDIISATLKIIELKDVYTRKHQENVATLIVNLAKYLNLSAEEKFTAYWAGLLHDIGKIGIPNRILKKPDRLTNEEYEIIKCHPSVGAEMLLSLNGFTKVATIISYHHERYDGMGYPYGIGGENIPFISRMLTICDAYDAMTSTRCYQNTLTTEQALAEIQTNCSSQFDADIAYSFIKLMKGENIQL